MLALKAINSKGGSDKAVRGDRPTRGQNMEIREGILCKGGGVECRQLET
jgi:hypothetical protein